MDFITLYLISLLLVILSIFIFILKEYQGEPLEKVGVGIGFFIIGAVIIYLNLKYWIFETNTLYLISYVVLALILFSIIYYRNKKLLT